MGFKNFDRFITEGEVLAGEANTDLGEREIQVSVAVLLLMVNESSSSPEKGEAMHQISTRMAEIFELSDIEVGEILEIAEVLNHSAERRDVLLQQLKDHATSDDRIQLFSLCCQVVIADGVLEESELQELTKIGGLLKLSLEQQLFARKIAEAGDIDESEE